MMQGVLMLMLNCNNELDLCSPLYEEELNGSSGDRNGSPGISFTDIWLFSIMPGSQSLEFEDTYNRKYDKRTCNGRVGRHAHSKKADYLVKKLIYEPLCTKVKWKSLFTKKLYIQFLLQLKKSILYGTFQLSLVILQ